MKQYKAAIAKQNKRDSSINNCRRAISIDYNNVNGLQMSENQGFTFQNTHDFKLDRIFDPFQYRHFSNEDQLETWLKEYYKYYYAIHIQADKIMSEAHINGFYKKYTDSIEYALYRVKYLKHLIHFTNLSLERHYDLQDESDDEGISTKMTTLNNHSDDEDNSYTLHTSPNVPSAEEHFTLGSLQSDSDEESMVYEISSYFHRLNRKKLLEIVSGTKLVWVPAVTIAMKCVNKILGHLTMALDYLTKNNKEQHKYVFLLVVKLAWCFDFFYGAMIASEKSPFYQKQECEDLKDHLEIVDVNDVNQFWKQTHKGVQNMGKVLGVFSRWMKHTSKTKQFISFMGWAAKYSWSKKKGIDQGLFFMEAFDKDTHQKVLKIKDTNTMKYLSKRKMPKVEVDQKLYIKMPQCDQLVESTNLYSADTPQMVSNHLEWPFELNIKNYNPWSKLKMRIIAKEDWGRVNWKNGTLNNPDSECIHMPVALFFIHGGGFKNGSSGMSNKVWRKYAIRTGYPVFAVDYRLSPEYKFPAHVSDCWQAYLWVRYYSEKYLGIRFQKIILVGDSAGASLSFSITNLAIKKKWIIPDGLWISYPAFSMDRYNFDPSLFICLDEAYVNTQFFDFWVSAYMADESSSKKYLCSPIYTPNKLIKHFPPIRMGIGGVDPVRDGALLVFRKWVKSGVNIKGKLYKHLSHGYLSMGGYPFNLEECRNAFEDTFVMLDELVKL